MLQTKKGLTSRPPVVRVIAGSGLKVIVSPLEPSPSVPRPTPVADHAFRAVNSCACPVMRRAAAALESTPGLTLIFQASRFELRDNGTAQANLKLPNQDDFQT